MMEELGERAQFLAAHLVTPGLVDYQHGFWEEAIFMAWKRCAESMEIEQLVAQAQEAEDKLKSKKADQQ
ncbi:hypothetical protein KEM55_004968 [Ascosphaera atra]|nr:hypothetical protein KEM55_004968 [Ascosphaera atra]